MIQLRPEILKKNGKNQFAILRWEDFQRIQEELEDLADIRALDRARAREGHLPGIPLAEVKRRLHAKLAGKSKRPRQKRA